MAVLRYTIFRAYVSSCSVRNIRHAPSLCSIRGIGRTTPCPGHILAARPALNEWLRPLVSFRKRWVLSAGLRCHEQIATTAHCRPTINLRRITSSATIAFSRQNDKSSSPPQLSPAPPPVVLNEDDIVETFVRGGGPGGQKINKTASCVMLKHIPTGIVVKCQESRSQHRNREFARRILLDKLDLAIRGEYSRMAMEAAKERARKAVRRRKCIKKHFKSRRDKALL